MNRTLLLSPCLATRSISGNLSSFLDLIGIRYRGEGKVWFNPLICSGKWSDQCFEKKPATGEKILGPSLSKMQKFKISNSSVMLLEFWPSNGKKLQKSHKNVQKLIWRPDDLPTLIPVPLAPPQKFYYEVY